MPIKRRKYTTRKPGKYTTIKTKSVKKTNVKRYARRSDFSPIKKISKETMEEPKIFAFIHPAMQIMEGNQKAGTSRRDAHTSSAIKQARIANLQRQCSCVEVSVCSCDAVSVCSCHSVQYCQCHSVPVCTCQAVEVCLCDTVCRCDPQCSCVGHFPIRKRSQPFCSCNPWCMCDAVPVP